MNNDTMTGIAYGLAVKKIDEELKSFKGDSKPKAVSSAVAIALKDFANQEPEFAEAIYQSDKTLSDCCTEIMKGVGQSISDIEVYKKAVGFYFPGADISFSMKIKVNPYEDGGSGTLDISLDDLFD